jgi:hypothetical protein
MPDEPQHPAFRRVLDQFSWTGSRMTIDRCDFQVPPAKPGWYGIISAAGGGAAFWSGRDWAPYPVLARTRSMQDFNTEAAALDWAASQRDGRTDAL